MDQVLCGICASSGSGNYQRDIRQFLFSHRSETETDLVIFSGDKSFKVHQAVILPLSDHLRELLPASCPCTRPAICLPPFPSNVLTAAIEILYTGTTTIVASLEDQIKVKEVFALLKIKADVDRDINIEATKKKIFEQVEEDLEAMFADLEDSDTVKQTKTKTSSESPLDEPKENKGELSTGTVVCKGVIPKNEPNDFSAIPENGHQITPHHQDIHSCYLDEVTGEFYKDERENVLVLENHDKEPSSCFKYIQSQGQTAPKMILNEATGVFCYDKRQNTSGLDEFENCIINHQKNVEIVTENKDVTPKLHNNENESVKKHEYDITKCPKQAKRKKLTNLYAFGSEEKHPLISSQTPKLTARKRKTKAPDEVRKGIKGLDRNLLSSVSKPQPGNKKRKVTGLDGSNLESVIKSKPRNGKQKIQSSSKFACSKCDYKNKRKDNLKRHIDGVHKKILYNCNECDYTTTWKITLKSHIDGVHKNILYKCEDCDYTTNMKDNLKRHIDGLHKKILYNCNECDYTTTWESSLKRHIDGVHKNILCKCDDCDYTTNHKDNLKRHIDGVHKKMLYNCNECDYTTTWKITLKRHIDGVHKNIWYKCEDCDYTTNKKENLKRHIDSVHKKILYNCHECDYTTTWKITLKSHIDGVHKNILYKCEDCDYTTNMKENLKRHIDGMHKKILYHCNECEYTTPWESSLKRHIDGVHKNILLKCDDCDYSTNQKDNLKRHVDGVHKKMLYNCIECDYTTTWKITLKRHIDGVHKNIWYKCEDCDYTTNKKENLKRHIDSVHKKILYNCHECDYTTTWESSLKGHNAAVHLKISHNCEKCDFTTKWKNHLKRHIHAAHENIYFNCDQCEFKTMWKTSLKSHLNAHKKIYFKCDQCDYETTWKGTFKRHIQGVHDNIVYKCNQCNFTTTWKEHLQRHIKSMHAGVSLPGSQCNPKAVNKPTARCRKSVHREVAANYCTRSQKMSPGVVAAVNSSPRVSENPSPLNGKAEQKRYFKRSRKPESENEYVEKEIPKDEPNNDVKLESDSNVTGIKKDMTTSRNMSQEYMEDKKKIKLGVYCILCQTHDHIFCEACVSNAICNDCGVKGHVRSDCKEEKCDPKNIKQEVKKET